MLLPLSYLDDGAVDVGGAHDLVVRDQLVFVHGTEHVAAGDGLFIGMPLYDTRYGIMSPQTSTTVTFRSPGHVRKIS